MSALTRFRDYQEKARQEAHETEHRRVIYAAPTGTGKTVVGCAVVLDDFLAGRRCLWLAHRRELVNQAVEQLKAVGIPEHEIGVIMSDDERVNPGARVQVASIATIYKRDLRPDADRVVLDEAHHAAAKTVAVICAYYNRARILGLTATPFRTGELQLGEYFNGIIYGPMPSTLIAAGWMMKPRCYAPPDEELPDLTEVRRDRESGDFQIDQLERAVNKRELVGSIVAHWKKLANGRRTIAFAVNIRHAQSIAAEFLAEGIPAEVLIGTTTKIERDLMFARLRAGVTKVLVTVGVLTEGWDAPWVKCAIIARPTCSLGLHVQMAGRILRPWGWGGVEPIILDHAANTNYFDVPHVDREMSLTMTMPRRGKSPGKAVVRNPVTGELISVAMGELEEVESVPAQALCTDCSRPLNMSINAVWRRRTGRTGSRCHPCARREVLSRRTTEQQRASSMGFWSKVTPEQKEARIANWHGGLKKFTPERRSAAMRKVKKDTPREQLSAAAKKGKAGMTPEQRRAAARKGKAGMTAEQRSEAMRKRAAAMSPERRKEICAIARAARRRDQAKRGRERASKTSEPDAE